MSTKPRFAIPHLLVLGWMVYLAVNIWQRALYSGQPPLYDPLSYMLKAKYFWHAVEQHKFFNPFNIEPTVRPPGTILMSYPFGFSPEYTGFHFRSVFLPILSIVSAVYVSAGVSRIKQHGWWVAAIALLLSSLPMFYCLDWVETVECQTRWGLVDNFQAGIAALAMAFTLRSLTSKSSIWLWGAAFLASFTLFIKPSGLMVMILIALVWLVAVTIQWNVIDKLSSDYQSFWKMLMGRGCALIIVYTIAILISFNSHYFHKSNFAYAKQAMQVMREVLNIPLYEYLLLFHRSSGEAVPVFIILVSLLYLPRIREEFGTANSDKPYGVILLFLSPFIWASGVLYWLVAQAGGSQIRYFYPFMLMGIFCVLPAAFHLWPLINRRWRFILLLVCLWPPINIGGLLAAGYSPSLDWQKMAGVSISVGADRQVVQQAYDFLREIRESGKSSQVYSFSNGIPSVVFENVGIYEVTVRPDQPVFLPVLSIDWLRGFAVRIEEMLDCDYILIRKYDQEVAAKALSARTITSYAEETKSFEVWLATLDQSSGVEIVSDGSQLRLLRIADRPTLYRAIAVFVADRQWRPEFTIANKPSLWWNESSVAAYITNPLVEEVEYEGVYRLHALIMNRTDTGLKLEVWWEELKTEEENSERRLFLHLLDAAGNIVENREIPLFPYKPAFEERRWRYGEVTFKLKSLDRDGAISLGFGVYQPPERFLRVDRGKTDWEGKRSIVPLDQSVLKKTS